MKHFPKCNITLAGCTRYNIALASLREAIMIGDFMSNYKEKIDEIVINAMDRYFNWLFDTFGLVGGFLITLMGLITIGVVITGIINMVV